MTASASPTTHPTTVRDVDTRRAAWLRRGNREGGWSRSRPDASRVGRALRARRRDRREDIKATSAPFRLLTALVVLTVVSAWVLVLDHDFGPRMGLADGTLLWFLPPVASLLLASWCRLRVARRRVLAAGELAGWRLTAFTAASNEVAWETTLDGTVTFAGPNVVNVLGYRPDEVIARTSSSLLAAGQADRLHALRSQAVTTGTGWAGETLTYLTKTGRPVTLSTSALLRQDDRGNPVGFTGILREVPADSHRRQVETATTARVRGVLDDGGLRIALQPIVDSRDGHLLGVEALSRFPGHPGITPERWFDEAASAGLGTDLELLAVKTALGHAGVLPPGVYLSVNASPATLASRRVHDLIEQASFPAEQIVVEITEHVSIDSYEHMRPLIADLRALGARLAVDDAGSGYASFRHILELSPDFIKLDRQLIGGIDNDPAKRALVVALVTFGREICATFVAEGIETAAELATVAELGVHAAQGFHIGRPLLVDAAGGDCLTAALDRPRWEQEVAGSLDRHREPV